MAKVRIYILICPQCFYLLKYTSYDDQEENIRKIPFVVLMVRNDYLQSYESDIEIDKSQKIKQLDYLFLR